MKTLLFLYRKWIKKECPHVCRLCKFNVNKKYCIEELTQKQKQRGLRKKGENNV